MVHEPISYTSKFCIKISATVQSDGDMQDPETLHPINTTSRRKESQSALTARVGLSLLSKLGVLWQDGDVATE